jgi:hypothetical protein
MTIKRDDAERAVRTVWEQWRAAHLPHDRQANGTDAFAFFGWLQSQRPDLLRFRYRGDKWQAIHGCLLRHRLVSD